MPVLDLIVALVPPWKQRILTVTISFSVPAEAGGLDPVDCKVHLMMSQAG